MEEIALRSQIRSDDQTLCTPHRILQTEPTTTCLHPGSNARVFYWKRACELHCKPASDEPGRLGLTAGHPQVRVRPRYPVEQESPPYPSDSIPVPRGDVPAVMGIQYNSFNFKIWETDQPCTRRTFLLCLLNTAPLSQFTSAARMIALGHFQCRALLPTCRVQCWTGDSEICVSSPGKNYSRCGGPDEYLGAHHNLGQSFAFPKPSCAASAQQAPAQVRLPVAYLETAAASSSPRLSARSRIPLEFLRLFVLLADV